MSLVEFDVNENGTWVSVSQTIYIYIYIHYCHWTIYLQFYEILCVTNDKYTHIYTVRSESLVAVYGSVTAITVALMVNSMVQCNLILAAILKNGKEYVSEAEEEEFIFRCCKYASLFEHGKRPPYPKRTFQKMWERRCECTFCLHCSCWNFYIRYKRIIICIFNEHHEPHNNWPANPISIVC